MSSYRKRPEHLTDEEYEMISEFCDRFQTCNTVFENAEKTEELIAKERAQMAKQAVHCRSVEDMLTKYENSAIYARNARDLADWKVMEDGCKKLREMLIEEKQQIAETEERITQLEERKAQLEQSAQDGTVDNARGLVYLCEFVDRRRKGWP